MPRSPCPASAGCTKNAGVPVDASVAASLRATCPDLPMPETTTRPWHRSISSTRGDERRAESLPRATRSRAPRWRARRGRAPARAAHRRTRSRALRASVRTSAWAVIVQSIPPGRSDARHAGHGGRDNVRSPLDAKEPMPHTLLLILLLLAASVVVVAICRARAAAADPRLPAGRHRARAACARRRCPTTRRRASSPSSASCS